MQTGRTPEVRFTDVTAEAGFPEHRTAAGALALGDYDGDGEDNLFVAPASLYHVHGGFVADVTGQTRPAPPRGAPLPTLPRLHNHRGRRPFVLRRGGPGDLPRHDGGAE